MSADASAEVRGCPRCGGTLDQGLAGGFCPRCVFAYVLELDSSTEVAAATGERGIRNVGGYRLLGEIARGGAGIVYRAWQSQLKREVALKMVLSTRLENAEALDRFRREAELMASLDHPGILPIYEVGTHAGKPWFSMKLAERGRLAERVGLLHGRYDEIARLLAQIVRAVGHAHRRGVLHRDLEPSNIVFDRDGQPLVTDFGLARPLSVDSSLTCIDALIGTPRYVAPEVVTTPGSELTAAVDVYGLGAILYELLTGAPPFAELAPLQVLHRIGTLRPHRPRRGDASIPAELEAICLRCLEKLPRDRYASADTLADALEHREGDTQLRVRRWAAKISRSLPSRRRIWGQRTFASVAIAAIALVFVLQRQGAFSSIPDPLVAMRTVAVLPVDLPSPPAAELAAVRSITAELAHALDVRVVPAATSLDRAQDADFPPSQLRRGIALGALMQVQVLAVDGPSQPLLRVRAVDVLRRTVVWKGNAGMADIGTMTQALAAALLAYHPDSPAAAEMPRAALAAFARGEALFYQYDSAANDAAIASFQRAIAIESRFAAAHAYLSFAYCQRSRRFGGAAFWNDSGIEEAERAARLDPTLPLASSALGYAFHSKGWLRRSIAAYEHAQTLGSDTNGDLPLAYFVVGRLDESFRLYRKNLEYAPHSMLTNYLASRVLFALGATDAGEYRMQLAIANERHPGKRSEMTAEIAFFRGDYARCRTLTAALDPDLASGGFGSAGDYERICAERQGDWPAALALLENDKQHYATGTGDLGNAGPALEEAVLLHQLGRDIQAAPALAAARRAAQAAIDGNREEPDVFLRMASAMRLSGDVDAAYDMLDRAFLHGLTLNADNSGDFEFLPFAADTRFAPLRMKSVAYVAAQRENVLKELDPAVGEPWPASAQSDAANQRVPTTPADMSGKPQR